MAEVSVIFCACNQGDWVRKTLPQARESLAGLDYELIVVDDQSIDGCCHDLGRDVVILRTPERLGVTGSRKFAVKRARGDVLLFSDPHCDYSGDALRELVEMAVDTLCICQPKSKSKPSERRERFGGVLLPCERGLRIKYQYSEPARYPALLGTVYAVRKEVYRYLNGWPQLPGCWGYAEQALTLQAWFQAVPIKVDTRHTIVHYNYQVDKKFPYSVSMGDQGANAHWVHALYFPETYHTHWLPILNARFGRKKVFTEQLWNRSFESQRSYLAERAERDEYEFYRECLRMPYPTPPAADSNPLGLISDEPTEKQQERISNAMGWMERCIHGCLKGRTVIDIGTPNAFISLDCLKQWEAGEIRAYSSTRELSTNGAVLYSDLSSIPEPDGFADTVCAFHSRVSEQQRDEMLRILKPGGHALITEKATTDALARGLWSVPSVASIKTKIKNCHGGKEVRLLARKKKD